MITAKKKIISFVLLLALIATPLTGCMGGGEQEAELENVILLPQLNFELANFIGQKVWSAGFYGNTSFTGDGIAFLVLNFNMLMVDEKLPDHSFARLDGNLPPSDMNSAEILVYGEVKDFAQEYNVSTLQSTPLITVEEYHILNQPSGVGEWGDSYILSALSSLIELIPSTKALAAEGADGTQAKDCDRALIISGGVDDNNNHERYKDNVIAKYKKLKELGFDKDQIDVVYNDASAIDVDGTNIVDKKATKQNIKDLIAKYAQEMPASCTLTIFVTDHGTGYNDKQGYHGARPALPGTAEYEGGKKYPESTFKIDARSKVYQETDTFTVNGKLWWATKDKTGKWEIYKKEGDDWVYKGTDANESGVITEGELGEDLNGDGDSNDGLGLSVAFLETRLGAELKHAKNEWDTDGDGTKDVRVRWNGTKYVIERLKDGTWQKMGEDTDGDFDIDGDDGGVDWNLDGDKGDQVGFHEGINLWGNEVLWDDELAEMLEPLREKGIHILVEMISCFSGGFVENLKGIVEKIVTGSSEDTKHWNRWDATEKKVYAADQKAFIENLAGIDAESWNEAWDKATAADRQAWETAGSNPVSENHPQKWEKPLIATESTFYEIDGVYTITLMIPESLAGKVYDMEILFGLQKPRWDYGEVLLIPEGFTPEEIAGGIKIKSAEPFPLTPLVFKIQGAQNAESLRIHITDKDHKNLGYITPTLEELPLPEDVLGGYLDIGAESFWTGPYTCESFFDIYFVVEDLTGGDFPLTNVTLNVNGEPVYDSGPISETIVERTTGPMEGNCGDIVAVELVAMNLVSTEPIVLRSETYVLPTPTVEEPIAEDVLSGYLDAHAYCECDQSLNCTYCDVYIYFEGEDISALLGPYPVTNVALWIFQGKVFDSGAISTSFYSNTFTIWDAGCGATYDFQLVVRNSIGLEVIVYGSITTPSFCIAE